MSARVEDVLQVLERLAPARLAEEWDNVGLQVGRRDWPVSRVLVALDLTPEVLAEAQAVDAQMLVTHHPLLFRPLKTLDLGVAAGGMLETLVARRLAVAAAHTNLDRVAGGVNDVLAQRVGLTATTGLSADGAPQAPWRLTVQAPGPQQAAMTQACREILTALAARGVPAEGRVLSLAPAGADGGDASPEEARAELRGAGGEEALRHLLPALAGWRCRLDRTVAVMPEDGGFGRLGSLEAPTTLAQLAQRVKDRLGLPAVRQVGRPDLAVRRVAVCAGSGGGLLEAFWRSPAEVLITGDLRYHDAREAEFRGRGLIDVGHFESEAPVREVLARRLADGLAADGRAVDVAVSRVETGPFAVV